MLDTVLVLLAGVGASALFFYQLCLLEKDIRKLQGQLGLFKEELAAVRRHVAELKEELNPKWQATDPQ